MTPEEEFERLTGGGGRTAEDEEFDRLTAPTPDYATKHPELQAKLDAATEAADQAHAAQSFVEKLATVATAARGAARGYTGHLSELLPQAESWAAASERDPATAMLFETGGAIASPFGRVLKGGGAFARGAGNGLIQSGTEVGVDAAQRGELNASDALQVGLGGVLGGVAPALGAGVAKLADSSAGLAAQKALGFGKREMDQLSKRFGVSGEELRQKVRDLAQKYAPSSMTNPMSVSDRAAALNAGKEAIGPEIDKALEVANSAEGLDAFIPDAWESMQGAMQRTAARDAAKAVGHEATAKANAYSSTVGQLAEQPAPKSLMEWRQAATDVRSPAWKSVGGPEGAAAEADALVGEQQSNVLKRLMKDYATDETNAAFMDANARYSDIATLSKLVEGRVNAEANGWLMPGVVSAGIGAGVGSVFGPDNGYGMAGGATAGLLASTNTGTRNFLSQALSSPKAADVMQHALGKVADMPTQWLQGLGSVSTGVTGAMKGHESSQKVKQMMQLDPGGLGEYGPALQKAMQQGRLSQEIDRISEFDPNFRMLLSR